MHGGSIQLKYRPYIRLKETNTAIIVTIYNTSR